MKKEEEVMNSKPKANPVSLQGWQLCKGFQDTFSDHADQNWDNRGGLSSGWKVSMCVPMVEQFGNSATTKWHYKKWN